MNAEGQPTGIRVMNVSHKPVWVTVRTPVGHLVEKGHLPQGSMEEETTPPRASS